MRTSTAHRGHFGKAQVVHDLDTAFHDYVLEWTHSSLDFYVDETRTLHIPCPAGADAHNWPFDAPHFIILNLAVGGNAVQSPDATTWVEPRIYEVDYVRVYKRVALRSKAAYDGTARGDRCSCENSARQSAAPAVPVAAAATAAAETAASRTRVYDDTEWRLSVKDVRALLSQGPALLLLRGMRLAGQPMGRRVSLAELAPLVPKLAGLQRLDLRGAHVACVGPLAGLQSLQTQKILAPPLRDISPLRALDQLRKLHVCNTAVQDVSALAPLRRLRRLFLNYNRQLGDVAPLGQLHGLLELHLAGTRVADVRGLAALRQLEILDVSTTCVKDVAPLASVASLRVLYLNSTGVADVSRLRQLQNLEQLHMHDSQVKERPEWAGPDVDVQV